MPPPQQEQEEEFGIWFATDRGIFENLPSGGGCNKENGWLDRTVGGGGGEAYCAAVLRRRSERGTRSFEPCSNNPLSICKVSQEPLSTTTYCEYVSRRGAWPNIRTPPTPPLNSTRRAAQYSPLFLRRLILLPPHPPTFLWCLLLSSTHTYYHYYTLARTRALMQKKSSRVCKKRATFCVATAAGEKKKTRRRQTFSRDSPPPPPHSPISRNLILGCVKTREREDAPINQLRLFRARRGGRQQPQSAFNSLPPPSLSPSSVLEFPPLFHFFPPVRNCLLNPAGGKGEKSGKPIAVRPVVYRRIKRFAESIRKGRR